MSVFFRPTKCVWHGRPHKASKEVTSAWCPRQFASLAEWFLSPSLISNFYWWLFAGLRCLALDSQKLQPHPGSIHGLSGWNPQVLLPPLRHLDRVPRRSGIDGSMWKHGLMPDILATSSHIILAICCRQWPNICVHLIKGMTLGHQQFQLPHVPWGFSNWGCIGVEIS